MNRNKWWSIAPAQSFWRSPGLLSMSAVLFFLFAAIEYYVWTASGRGAIAFDALDSAVQTNVEAARGGQIFVAMLAAVFWGVYRATAQSPFYRRDYAEFLARSPWTYGKPLPFGPAHLTLLDAGVFGALSLAATRAHVDTWMVLAIAGLVAYGGLVALAMYWVRRYDWFFAIAFTFVSVVYVVDSASGLAVWIAVTVAIVNGAIGAMLRAVSSGETFGLEIPENWATSDIWSWFRPRAAGASDPREAGWPLGVLAPLGVPEPPKFGRAYLWCLFIGWSAAAFAPVDPSGDSFGGWMSAMITMIMFFGILRMGHVAAGCKPPINLCGRIFTFRWIVPRHDIVVLPLLAGLAWAVALFINLVVIFARETSEPPNVAVSRVWVFLTVAGGLAFVASVPPFRRNWQLTGGYQAPPAKQVKSKQI